MSFVRIVAGVIVLTVEQVQRMSRQELEVAARGFNIDPGKFTDHTLRRMVSTRVKRMAREA